MKKLTRISLAIIVLLASGCMNTGSPRQLRDNLPDQLAEQLNLAERADTAVPTVSISESISYAQAAQDQLINEIIDKNKLVDAVALSSLFIVGGLAVDSIIDASPDAVSVGGGLITTLSYMAGWVIGDLPGGEDNSSKRDEVRVEATKSLICAIGAVLPMESVDANRLESALAGLAQSLADVEAAKPIVSFNAAILTEQQRQKIDEYLVEVDVVTGAVASTHAKGEQFISQWRRSGRRLQSTTDFIMLRVFERDLLTRPKLKELRQQLNALVTDIPSFVTFPSVPVPNLPSGEIIATSNDEALDGNDDEKRQIANLDKVRQSLGTLGAAIGKVRQASVIVESISTSIPHTKNTVALLKDECGIEITIPPEKLVIDGATTLKFTAGESDSKPFKVRKGSGSYGIQKGQGKFGSEVIVSHDSSDFTVFITKDAQAGRRTFKIFDRKSESQFIEINIFVETKANSASETTKDKTPALPENPKVRRMQEQLFKLGMLTSRSKIDGRCGVITTTAINAFVNTIGLSVTLSCPASDDLTELLSEFEGRLKGDKESIGVDELRIYTIESLLAKSYPDAKININGELDAAERAFILPGGKTLSANPTTQQLISSIKLLR